MSKVILTRGLPASGKSTWSKQYIADNPNFKRVNKDDLRAMLDKSWSKRNEGFVLEVRDFIITKALKEGYSIIVDDTNLADKHEKHIRHLANVQNADFEVKWFTASVEQCLVNDKKRPTYVGEKVIRGMYNQYKQLLNDNGITEKGLSTDTVYIPPNKPKCVIFDIDGTLAHMKKNGRGPYDWHRVGEDIVDTHVAKILKLYQDSGEYVIILLSGRDSVCRPETTKWLQENNIYYDLLFMRPEKNQEKDSKIKRQIFEQLIRDHFAVDVIYDDRQQVVDMWRSLGLKCLQVAPGYF